MLTPLIQKFFYGDKQPGFFASIIIASIAAQLLCLPLSLYYFGSFSLLAVFANLLVSPTISIVMLLTLIVGITRFAPLAFFAEKILQFQLVVIRRMASFSWGGVEMAAYNPRVFLIYVLIALLAVWLYRKTGHSFRPHYDLEKS